MRRAPAQAAAPILNTDVPHTPHVPRVAGLPFAIVTAVASRRSRFSRHFTQYACTMPEVGQGAGLAVRVPPPGRRDVS